MTAPQTRQRKSKRLLANGAQGSDTPQYTSEIDTTVKTSKHAGSKTGLGSYGMAFAALAVLGALTFGTSHLWRQKPMSLSHVKPSALGEYQLPSSSTCGESWSGMHGYPCKDVHRRNVQ